MKPVVSTGLTWWCGEQTTEFLIEELDRAVGLELHLRNMARADPDNAPAYRLSILRTIEREIAMQTELDRRLS